MKGNQFVFLIILLHSFFAFCASAQNKYCTQEITTPTKWTKEVLPTNPLPEYPRPQMVRSKWANLNGLWDYAITKKGAEFPKTFAGKILVPYPLESALSGIRRAIQPEELVWYRKTIKRPSAHAKDRILLHFGAVDFEATIYINGREIGKHKGGYQNFSFDITGDLHQENNELFVKVWDPSDKGPNPHGKQVLDPGGIMYTPSSGIWQTVWMETVPADYISSITITPDIDKSVVNITVKSTSDSEVKLESAGKTIVGRSNSVISFPVAKPKLWSPDVPYLYDLKISMGRDKVKSYFGMRKIEIKKDEKGIERIFLNNRYTYNLGTLDQGFWPDGLYTAPTDEALAFDIKASKAMGFNTIRKHIKIEPARWYYHCDKLGMLVWQDMVNPGNDTPEGREQFEKENQENISQLYNYPSIICWVLFNEGWGAYDQARLTKWIKVRDNTRLINGHSGSLIVNYNDEKNTPEGLADKSANSDMTDVHSYPPPGIPAYIPGKAMVLGEFGGIGVPIESHLWDDIAAGWGYGGTVSAGTMRKQYALMTDSLIAFEKRGLSASIYTQPFDVETEQNGLMTYDRRILKIPVVEIRRIHSKLWPITANYLSATKGFSATIADSANKDFATRLKEYKAGKKDSASLRALAIMAAAQKDSMTQGGVLIANEYIALIKDPLAEVNVKFIERFTNSSEESGYRFLVEFAEKKNEMGERVKNRRLQDIIFREQVRALLTENPDWNQILAVIQKHPEIDGEPIIGLSVIYYLNAQHKNQRNAIKNFIKAATIYDEKYNDGAYNTWAWVLFQKSNDKTELEKALEWSRKEVERTNESDAMILDTYANLVYKLGQKEEGIKWEKMAVKLNPQYQIIVDKMEKGIPTWPVQEGHEKKRKLMITTIKVKLTPCDLSGVFFCVSTRATAYLNKS